MKINFKRLALSLLLCLCSSITLAMNKESKLEQSKKKIAVLICNKFSIVPTASDNDGLPAAFDAVGMLYEPVIWDKPAINWSAYDAVLIRATWDYIEKPQEFLALLQAISDKGIPLLNPFETIKWNSKKSYLDGLANQGIPIFETHTVCRRTMPDLTTLMNTLADVEYVIKPAISGGAHKTFRATRATIQNIYAQEYERDQEVLIQPFAPEIMEEGEWELIFFNGIYSHAILATPKAGDFRVQRKHGGTVKSVTPPADMITQAQQVLSLTPGGIPLYARVDFVRRGEQHYLMELEVIEPSLYLKFCQGSSERFAQALKKRLLLFN